MDKSVPVTLPEGFVEFYEDVESWQNELFFRLKKKTDSKKVDAIPLLKREDRPLLEFLDFEVDLTEYREAFLSFAQLLKDKREKASLFVDRIMDIKDELDYGELLTRALENDKKYFSGLENETGVPASIMTMISQHAVRPFLRVFALPYEQSIREDESLGGAKGCALCAELCRAYRGFGLLMAGVSSSVKNVLRSGNTATWLASTVETRSLLHQVFCGRW